MEPPFCKVCGKRHWSRMCEPVTADVTQPGPVTMPVTPNPVSRLMLERENEALRLEVVKLKQALSEAHGAKPLAMTGAQRVARLRAKRKETGDGGPPRNRR